MPLFRKKPAVIEARRLVVGTYFGDWPDVKVNDPRAPGGAVVETLEGVMIAQSGDYIIKGCPRRIYPCKADIFHETYEEVK